MSYGCLTPHWEHCGVRVSYPARNRTTRDYGCLQARTEALTESYTHGCQRRAPMRSTMTELPWWLFVCECMFFCVYCICVCVSVYVYIMHPALGPIHANTHNHLRPRAKPPSRAGPSEGLCAPYRSHAPWLASKCERRFQTADATSSARHRHRGRCRGRRVRQTNSAR